MAKTLPHQIPLVILGSARYDSDTEKLVNALLHNREFSLINLIVYPIAHYSYTGDYPANDRFQEIVAQIQQHDKIVFATPVYWYSMSGSMKVFFDRLTDLVTIHKEKGRSLKGKEVFLVATGSDDSLPLGFEEPFRLTASYFEMKYQGSFYATTLPSNHGVLGTEEFVSKLFKL